MVTLSKDSPRRFEQGNIQEYPVLGGAVIFVGAAVGANDQGYARPLVSGDYFLGFAERTVNNSRGLNGAVRVPVLRRGQVRLAVTGATSLSAVANTLVYATDDDTFSITATSGTLAGRVVRQEPDGQFIVEFDTRDASAERASVRIDDFGGMKVVKPALSGHALIRAIEADTGARVHLEPNGFPVGTQAKFDWMFDPYDDDGTNYSIFNVVTKGYNAADTASAWGPVAFLGSKSVGHGWAVKPPIHIGFSDNGADSATPLKLYYFDTAASTHYTPYLGKWRPGMAVTTGDYVGANNKIYQAASTGTTGATAPSHTSSTVSDGAVDWLWISTPNSSNYRGVTVVGHRDDLPKLGWADVRLQASRDMAMWNTRGLWFAGNTDVLDWRLYSPSGTRHFQIEMNDGTARFLRFNYPSRLIQSSGLGLAHGVSTLITSGDATPSILGVRVLQTQGTTTITAFDDGVPLQDFYVLFGGGLTIENNANIVLKGGANLTPASGRILHFMTNSAGTVAREIGV